MPRWMIPALGLLLLGVPCPAPACSICGINLQQAPTLRQEAGQTNARLVLFGSLQPVKDSATSTELHIEKVLRSDAELGDKKMVVLPRYIPVTDPKNPPRFLVFCDRFKGQLDPYRGVPIRSADGLDYVQKALALDPRDRLAGLEFFFRFLDHPDKEVAADAFLEFAKATDQEVAQVARKLSPAKLRDWLKNAETPPERLGLYALLLGGCGGDADAAVLRALLGETSDRIVNAYDGILGGYIHLRPREGWDLALATLRDGSKPLPVRLAVVRTLRFYHGAQPRESRANVLKAVEAMIVQGELADLALEDLRRWQIWDLTREVLSLYGKKGYDAPIVQRAIVRYALSCKDDNAALRFVADRRRQEPDLVKEVEESLELEKQK